MKLYHAQKDGCVGHGGKEYPVVNGEVDVPDEAVALLTESFGFSVTQPDEAEEDAPAPKKGGKKAKPDEAE